MLNSKQRAQLRKIAATTDPIINIGKGGISPEITQLLDEALEAREIVKISILSNSDEDINEISSVLAERTHSDVVQVIGKKAVFFRQSKKNPKIEIK